MRSGMVRLMLNEIITSCEVPTFSVDVFIAGSHSVAIEAMREFCLVGLCVTVSETTYVYTGGMECGVRVGLINYPRFPSDPDSIFSTALDIGEFLIRKLHQQSCTIVGPNRTVFLSRRP